MSQFHNPVRLYFDKYGAASMADTIRERFASISRVLVLTRGGNVEKSDGLQPLLDTLEGKQVCLKELQLSNPDIKDVLSLTEEVAGFDYELIVAIGGGSVMDMAKTMSALQHLSLKQTEDVRQGITGERYRAQAGFTPWIGIPTTSGTGSEVTSWATVWDKELGLKYSVSDKRLYADCALIMPSLTEQMPLRLSVVTALDAMCHATEAYWSVNTNPITRGYALQAIQRIITYLPSLQEENRSKETRAQLALGSVYAGLAFSNTMTTACHSISYPMTLMFGIEHGIAASFTLGAVFKLNEPAIIEKDRLLEAFGAKNAGDVQQIIFGIYKQYGISNQLRSYGIGELQVNELAKRAFTKGRMNNNPVELSRSQVEELLTSLI
ncbi:phosphonoacetaldehyde reductase [Paenibacillus sp. FSL R10-2734]|uniref:phosphonoacetaldehyde reductase n=1 Tax=Paenibacillus sp. FSL R10-2734 TaxID=2954691 RepID=UPI0030D6DC0C